MLGAQPLVRVALRIQLRCATCHTGALEAGHDLIHFLGQVVHRLLWRLFAGNGNGDVLPPELRQLRIIRHVRSGRRPGNACRAAIELDQATELRRHFGHRCRLDVGLADRGQADRRLLQRSGLRGHELRVEPRTGQLVGIMPFEEGPRADVLVAVLHALLPVRAVRARGHAPLRRTVLVHDRQTLLGHVGGEGGVPEDLLSDLALCRDRARFAEGHAGSFLRRVLLHPIDILGQRVNRCRRVGRATASHRGALRVATVGGSTDAPLVDRLAIRDTDVSGTGHRQPRIGETPSE